MPLSDVDQQLELGRLRPRRGHVCPDSDQARGAGNDSRIGTGVLADGERIAVHDRRRAQHRVVRTGRGEDHSPLLPWHAHRLVAVVHAPGVRDGSGHGDAGAEPQLTPHHLNVALTADGEGRCQTRQGVGSWSQRELLNRHEPRLVVASTSIATHAHESVGGSGAVAQRRIGGADRDGAVDRRCEQDTPQ